MGRETIRATLYLEAALHQAVRLKAARTGRSMSDIVNDAVRMALREDEEDLAAFAERAEEKSVSDEEFQARLKAQRERQAERAMEVIRDIQRYASSGGRKFTRDEMNERR